MIKYMDKFLNWLNEYPFYALTLVAVLVVAFFVFKAAGKSYRCYYERYKAEEAEIKRLLKLKEEFSNLNEEVIRNADETELLEGTALCYQLMLQKCENMEAEFSKLNCKKQYVYALDVFCAEKSIREFFSQNGKELKNIIVSAFSMIGLKSEGKKLEAIKNMFDDEDMETSIDEKAINEVQIYFDENAILTMVKEKSAKYIKENPNDFVI